MALGNSAVFAFAARLLREAYERDYYVSKYISYSTVYNSNYCAALT